MEINVRGNKIGVLVVILKLFGGFFTAALGIVCMINANLGLSPWDVLHQGITNIIDITMGQASIAAGIVVVIASMFLGVKVGIGTILNMIFIGIFIDLITASNIVPTANNSFIGICLLIMGMVFMSIGTCLYLSCELGCGPRDGLMSALTRITNKPVKVVRAVIEIGALIFGWLLGGFVGLGTLISALGLGYFIQICCKIFKLDITTLNHRNIFDDLKIIHKKLVK